MYQSYYGLTASPFQLTPDKRFFFGSAVHQRALAHVRFGLEQADGFIVITGEIGAGKTTLIEHLVASLDPASTCIARIVTTQMSNDDVFRLAIAGFGVDITQLDKAANILAFQAALRSHAEQGRRCLLIVDEAQNLPLPALEELRMLSNLAAIGQIPLQTILLAQPEFRRKLATRPLDQLRQRVIASFHLAPLGEDEIAPYISHRLLMAGWAGRPKIEPAALTVLFKATAGVPRQINRLFARVLLLGALEGIDLITAATVTSAAAKLTADLAGSKPRRKLL